MKNLYKIGDDLYIVSSSEKIKENTQTRIEGLNGDWFYNTIYNFIARTGDITSYDFKIILTTNKLLIKDGVQSIDDEFLEWICKNPSCEVVETFIFGFDDSIISHSKKYEIIIPSSESKQEFCDNCNNDICCCIVRKQETPEEAAYRLSAEKFEPKHIGFMLGVIEGAKWQKEQDLNMVQGYLSANLKNIELLKRMYSEEDLRKAIQLARLCTLDGNIGEFVDLTGLTEVCTYGLKETHSEDLIIEQFKKK